MSSPDYQKKVILLAKNMPKRMERHELANLASDKATAFMRQARRDKNTKLRDFIGAINLNCCYDKITVSAQAVGRDGQANSHLAEVDFLPESRKLTRLGHKAMLALLGPNRFSEIFAKRLVEEFSRIEAALIQRGSLPPPKI